MHKKTLSVLILLSVFMGACGSTPISPSPVAIVTEESPSVPETQIPPQPEQPSDNSGMWKAVRDTRYGFGLAVPCWWLVDPIPAEGFGGVMTIKNYDEDYFIAHSTKGFWEWPNGTLKIDVVIMEGMDPAKADADTYMQFTDPTMTGLVSVESQQTGAHSASVLTLSNLVNTNDPDTKMFIYRLAPDKLILVAPTPQNIIDSSDFQALLASLVLTPDEQVVLPTIAPAPALIASSCAG